jgi:hypothetical protein
LQKSLHEHGFSKPELASEKLGMKHRGVKGKQSNQKV